MTDPLTRLAILNGTDKFGYHDYTPHYFSLLKGLRDRPLNMLEIGVGGYGDPARGGESLATWRDFFPEAQITGLDIQEKTMDLGPRVRIVQGSQVDADCLSQIVAERGPFDVILDDGSHRNEHVVESFGLLFPTLKPGGIYLVEDVQTAFFPRFGGSLTLDAPNSVGLGVDHLGRILDGTAGDIAAIERVHNIIAFLKRDPDAPRLTSAGDRRLVGDAGQVVRVAAAEIADAEALARVIAEIGDDGVLAIEGLPDQALLSQIFIQIDHVEIRVHHPDAPILDVARRILGMTVYPDGVVMQIGDNSYPSNFTFDSGHPRAAAALTAIAEVIADPAATMNGLQQAAGLIERFHGTEAAIPLMARLAEMGCTDQRFYLFQAKQLMQAGSWDGLERLCREALTHLPGDPFLQPQLATALRKQGRADEALQLLRDAHAADPRQRALVMALANLELAMKNPDRAIALMEKAMVLFPVAHRPERLRRLIELCQANGDQAAAQRAALRLRDLTPEDPLVAQVLAESST